MTFSLKDRHLSHNLILLLKSPQLTCHTSHPSIYPSSSVYTMKLQNYACTRLAFNWHIFALKHLYTLVACMRYGFIQLYWCNLVLYNNFCYFLIVAQRESQPRVKFYRNNILKSQIPLEITISMNTGKEFPIDCHYKTVWKLTLLNVCFICFFCRHSSSIISVNKSNNKEMT